VRARERRESVRDAHHAYISRYVYHQKLGDKERLLRALSLLLLASVQERERGREGGEQGGERDMRERKSEVVSKRHTYTYTHTDMHACSTQPYVHI
jgi:hypothetical protein